MKKANFVELSLSERSDLYKYCFLFSSISDLLTSSPEYVKRKTFLIDRGVKLLDDMLDGQKFVLGEKSSFARDNLQLYSYYSDSYSLAKSRIPGHKPESNYPDELKKFIEVVKGALNEMRDNPAKVESDDDDIEGARLLFDTLSNSVNSKL